MKTFVRWIFVLFFLGGGMLFLAGKDRCLAWAEAAAVKAAERQTAERIFRGGVTVPAADWALVPGTSIHGEKLRQRCRVAASLYRAGKVSRFLLSGDGRHPSYDEPAAMKRMLLELGVPAKALVLDRAGLSTFESMQSAQRVDGSARWIVVTQREFAPRALLLADGAGLNAVAVAADGQASFLVSGRERKATLRAVLDLLGARKWTERWEAAGEVRIAGVVVF